MITTACLASFVASDIYDKCCSIIFWFTKGTTIASEVPLLIQTGRSWPIIELLFCSPNLASSWTHMFILSSGKWPGILVIVFIWNFLKDACTSSDCFGCLEREVIHETPFFLEKNKWSPRDSFYWTLWQYRYGYQRQWVDRLTLRNFAISVRDFFSLKCAKASNHIFICIEVWVRESDLKSVLFISSILQYLYDE